MTAMPHLGCRSVAHSFGSDAVLTDVSLSVNPREMVCLYGASGSGKSTLVNILSGIYVPDRGSVIALGQELTQLSDRSRSALRLKEIGLVFQNPNLVEEFTASENVELLLLARGFDRTAAKGLALEALRSVGIAELAERRPPQMSGGQAQRVGIARALAGRRKILIADEPTGALDDRNSRVLFELLAELAASEDLAVLVCTHDLAALPYADRVLSLIDGHITEGQDNLVREFQSTTPLTTRSPTD